jgi:hypothetical protein
LVADWVLQRDQLHDHALELSKIRQQFLEKAKLFVEEAAGAASVSYLGSG